MNEKDKIYLAHFLFPEQTVSAEMPDLMRTAATAERICRLKYTEGEHIQDISLQVHKDRTVVSCGNTSAPSSYELQGQAQVERALALWLNCFDLPEPYHSAFPALVMSRTKYEELKKITSSSALHKLAQGLTEATGDNVHSVQLAKVMKYCIAEGELRLCSRSHSGWSLHYASFIDAHSGGWLLRMRFDADNDGMVAIPMSKAQFCAILTGWLLKPSPF